MKYKGEGNLFTQIFWEEISLIRDSFTLKFALDIQQNSMKEYFIRQGTTYKKNLELSFRSTMLAFFQFNITMLKVSDW